MSDAPSDAQREALAEAREIEAASGGSFSVEDSSFEDGWLTLDVAVDASPFIEGRAPDGLLFEPTERVRIHLPPTFPLGYPRASVDHTRFAGFENVLRGDGLCLFRSPSTDWSPALGLAGFVRDRLWTWFERVSLGTLEQQGGAFHAPVLNGLPPVPASVVLQADEPAVERPWLGFTRLRLRDRPAVETTGVAPLRADLVGWAANTDRHVRGETFGAAALVESRLGFEFPHTLGALLAALDEARVPPRAVVDHLGQTARAGTRGHPLFLTVGTPMRSSGGSHFLTTLLLEPEAARALWDAGGTRLRDAAVERVLARADETIVFVCGAHEARPSVAVRRDRGAPAAWFEGRQVSVWGCGALGAPIALAAARAGASRLVLRDRGVVSPGLLARQPYTDADVDLYKVDALRHRLRAVRPDLDVEVHVGDVTRLPAGADWTDGADFVVNATASRSVRALLDLRRGSSAPVPVLTVGVDGRAERVFARLLPAHADSGVADLEREVKLALADRPDVVHFADAFFPASDAVESGPFYPEPGCSESTFVGSVADLAGLAATALNWATAWLAASPSDAVALLAAPPHVTVGSSLLPHIEVSATPRVSLSDPRSGYIVKLAPEAVRAIERAVDDSPSRLGPGVETGGPVYGAWDVLRRIVWVDRVGPPPPDSVEARDRFVCGVEGLSDETDRLATSTRGAVGFVGTWHTHPLDPPDPSGRDLASLADVFSRPEQLPRVFTMLIAGASSEGPVLKAHVFYRAEFVATADP